MWRPWWFGTAVCVACSGLDVQPGGLCVALEGDPQCAPATATRADVDGQVAVRVTSVVSIVGAELGYEQVDAEIALRVDPATLDAVGEASVAPALLTCFLDILHGDHCHLGIPTDRGCAVPLPEGSFRAVTVDVLDEQRVVGRFTARLNGDSPDCCTSTCPDLDRDLGVEPAGPWRVEGTFDVPFAATE